jgi:hypothetical protein
MRAAWPCLVPPSLSSSPPRRRRTDKKTPTPRVPFTAPVAALAALRAARAHARSTVALSRHLPLSLLAQACVAPHAMNGYKRHLPQCILSAPLVSPSTGLGAPDPLRVARGGVTDFPDHLGAAPGGVADFPDHRSRSAPPLRTGELHSSVACLPRFVLELSTMSGRFIVSIGCSR